MLDGAKDRCPLVALALALALLVPTGARAQESASTLPQAPEPRAAGVPARACGSCTQLGTLPPTDGTGRPGWTWIRLKTGETFGGAFHGVRDGRLYFDSNEVGDLDLNWRSIWEIHAQRPVTVVLRDHTFVVGSIRMEDNTTIYVRSAEGELAIPKQRVLRINSAGEGELEKWNFKLSVGVNVADATVDQLTLSSRTRIARDDEYTRLSLSHDFSFGRTQNVMGVETDTSNNQWGLLQFDYFVSPVFYATLAGVSMGYDILQNLGLRVTPGAGMGVHILDGGPELDFELLGIYQYTRFFSVMAGAAEDTNGGGGGYRIYFEWKVVPNMLEVELDHRGFIVYSDDPIANPFGQSSFRTSLTIEFDLGTYLDFAVTGIHDRVVEPRQTADGTVPQADTWTLLVGLGIELGL